MTSFLVFVGFLIAISSGYEIFNDPQTAFGSCQDALFRNPLAEDGLYYIDNFDNVEPYLTFCLMSVNGGGWTMFYKNSNEQPEGDSYMDLLKNSTSFISSADDLTSVSVRGVYNFTGLNAVSMLAMPVGSSSYSAVDFGTVDIADSVISNIDIVEGDNEFTDEMSYVFNNSIPFTFHSFEYDNGTFVIPTGENDEVRWFGNVLNRDETRLESCGGIEATHCMYFLRERVTSIIPGDPNHCFCLASGEDNVIWPAIECGRDQVVSCAGGSQNGSLTRHCNDNGMWEEPPEESTCSCPAQTYQGVEWPITAGGETATFSCVGQPTQKRTRTCLFNGEWDDKVDGVCTCKADSYPRIQWYETEGGREAVHECDLGAEGEGYTRQCNADGTWVNEVQGTCVCPTTQMHGFQWLAANATSTQTELCAEGAEGTTISRTCGVYGSWERVEGNCDCPEQEVDGVTYPRTHSGSEARVSCVLGAIGTAYTRMCESRGQWGEVQEGSCACPTQSWTNYAGTTYTFEETPGLEVVSMPCVNDPSQNITRTCSLFGEWEAPEGCEEAVYCPAETIGELEFTETLGGTAMMIPCAGSNTSMSYGRYCQPNGQWGPVVGYCQCPEEKDVYGLQWASLRSERSVTQTCAEGYSGTITRECSFFGAWNEQDNCVRNTCPAETVDDVEWPVTNSMTKAEVICGGGSIQRECMADGVWDKMSGSCKCPATVMDGHFLEERSFHEQLPFPCGDGFRGSDVYECRGQGQWVRISQCQIATCPAQTYQEVEWPETLAGSVAAVECLSNSNIMLSRPCDKSGNWASTVSGGPCGCNAYTTEDGLYTFSASSPKTVELSCHLPFFGKISYRCNKAGAWVDFNDNCQRHMCPAETINGVEYPATEAGTTFTLPCAEGALGTGYSRECTLEGHWRVPSGSCSCALDEVRHVDGHLYVFPETAANGITSQLCAGDLAGSITRVCSPVGSWEEVRGECMRLQCPEEILSGYVWPATNSSTTVEMPCHEYQIGTISRTCFAAGLWGEPQNNCSNQQCEPLQVNRLANGSMNIRFNTPSSQPYVQVNVVPSNSHDSVIVRGRTVRIDGLQANIAYSLFVQYCPDQTLQGCTTGCIMDNVYYQEVCDAQPAIDIVDFKREEEKSSITFSSKMPACPKTPEVLEIVYKCVEGCESSEEVVHSTRCNAIGGCQAGQRVDITIEGDFPNTAKYQVRQRVRIQSEFSDLQVFSPVREFTIYDLLRVHQLEPTVEFIHSHRVRLNLGNLLEGSVAYSKHSIYVYKKLTGTRRLVDSLLSQTTICPTGQGICEETSAEFAVEPGYDYSFSVYSYPLISNGKVAVATTHVSIPEMPPAAMNIVPGDHFILVTLSGALYPLTGYCTFAPHQMLSSAQKYVYVELSAGESLEVVGTELMLDTDYTVTCSLSSEMQLGTRLVQSVRTLPLQPPTLVLSYVEDTTHDVHITVTTNKPAMLYCMTTLPADEPTEGQLKAVGTAVVVPTAHKAVSVFLQLFTTFPDDYQVTCLAEDTYYQTVKAILRVEPSRTPYEPELLAVVPANNAVDVAPRVSMELHFKYPVSVSTCPHCFFILYDTKLRQSTNLYNTAFVVEGKTIRFHPLQLNSATTYQLKTSTQGLIVDKMNNVDFDAGTDILTTFTVKTYKDVTGEVEMPEGDFFPINGVLRFNYDGYMFLHEGTITLNSLSVEASNPCLQITHANAEQTTLTIPVAECVGLLRSNASYVMVLPEGLLQSRDLVLSPRISHLFHTSLETFAPQVVNTYPEEGATMVPLDTPVKLYFDQPVKFGTGFLFISEFYGSQYLNSFNLPASKATYGTTFPYEVSWEGNLFTLKPYHTYVVSWSEGAVLNARDEPLPASTSLETVSFITGKTACSADFLAESIYGTFECTYEENVCKCSQWNIMAMAF